MRRYFPFLLMLTVFVYCAVTAFQCGSAETTSAKLYMQQKQWEKAQESLQKEVVKNDKNEEAWFLLGSVRYELKDYKGMYEAHSKALALGNMHEKEILNNRLAIWASKYNEGVNLYNKGKEDPVNYDKAIDAYNIAIMMVPDSSGTYYVNSLAYYSKKEFAKAKENLQIALKKKPDFAEAAMFLAQLYYADGATKVEQKDEAGAKADFVKAVSLYEVVYKKDPSNGENITRLIEAYERAGESEKAMTLTRDAVTRDPNNKVYRYAYGVFLLKQDQFEKAIEQFGKAIEIDPGYGDAIYNTGVAYLNWGVNLKVEADKKAEAERLKNKGKDVKEDMTYKERFKSSLPFLEKAVEQRSDDAALWQSLGKVYLNLNMKEKSESAFKKFDLLTKAK
jgi:tetratricopeptide (TPR) repeat protein